MIFLKTDEEVELMRCKVFTLGLCVALMMSGCQTKTGTGAGIGAGGGAVLGGILGQVIGHNTKSTMIGAAIGAAVGAGTGAIIGHRMDKVAAEAAAQVPDATVEQVEDANGLPCVKLTLDNGILFKTNKYDLNDNSKASLAKLANVMRNNADCSIDIQGHTDSKGTDAINNPLSMNRAQSVANYLNTCGVPASQFKNVSGFGSTQPVADNATEEGRQKNRRVEIYLYASEEMIQKANNGTL
jgi:outer membrane protein OmpA-like peptidoglycan-associated protein